MLYTNKTYDFSEPSDKHLEEKNISKVSNIFLPKPGSGKSPMDRFQKIASRRLKITTR